MPTAERRKRMRKVESERKGIRKELKIYSATRKERAPVGNICRKERICELEGIIEIEGFSDEHLTILSLI